LSELVAIVKGLTPEKVLKWATVLFVVGVQATALIWLISYAWRNS
jgi:hypothetical protein